MLVVPLQFRKRKREGLRRQAIELRSSPIPSTDTVCVAGRQNVAPDTVPEHAVRANGHARHVAMDSLRPSSLNERPYAVILHVRICAASPIGFLAASA